jgi:molybdenum cofactor guanylyltransferase
MIRPAITGIILAGGESRRMGTLKPLIIYRGKPLIHWIFEALHPVCSKVLIIANSGDYSDLDATVYPDSFPGNGPAAGIETGLFYCPSDLALISSCDTPNLPADFFRYLLANHHGYEVSIAAHDDINEPLIGVYSRSVRHVFRNAVLAGDPHPPRIIRQCKWHEIQINSGCSFFRPDLFLNLNSPPDLKK